MTGYDDSRKESFMEKIVNEIYRGAISDTFKLIENPPGREPHASLVSLNQWYAALSDEDKDQVHKVATWAADLALFGLFAAFDGVRNIGLDGEISVIENGYNMSDNCDLHEIYRATATDIFE